MQGQETNYDLTALEQDVTERYAVLQIDSLYC